MPYLTNTHLPVAYLQGADAYASKLKWADNPHDDPCNKESWNQGFLDACRSYEPSTQEKSA